MKIDLFMFDKPRFKIAAVLHQGHENGMTMAELQQIFGRTDREIRHEVHRERMEGAVILAGECGFYLPSEDPAEALREIKAFEHRMEAKARNTLAATRSATLAREMLEARYDR